MQDVLLITIVMRKLFCFLIVVVVALSAGAQVKIGHSPADVNPGAVL